MKWKFRIYHPRHYIGCNYGADADADGYPIDLDRFYVEATPQHGDGEPFICSGPLDTPAQAADKALDFTRVVALLG
jgi:hypothetical protein